MNTTIKSGEYPRSEFASALGRMSGDNIKSRHSGKGASVSMGEKESVNANSNQPTIPVKNAIENDLFSVRKMIDHHRMMGIASGGTDITPVEMNHIKEALRSLSAQEKELKSQIEAAQTKMKGNEEKTTDSGAEVKKDKQPRVSENADKVAAALDRVRGTHVH